MRYGLTGTRSLWSEDLDLIEDCLPHELSDGTEFTTGACIGFDTLAGRLLVRRFPDALHRVIVPADRSRVDSWYLEFPEVEVIEMPEGTSYRDRNERIVDFADTLFFCADYPESHGKSLRSGTWMTVRIARRRRVPYRGIVLRPS